MKTRRILLATILTACLWINSATGTVNNVTVRSNLPTASTAKDILNTTTRHREWVSIPVGSASILAFIVYPERTDKAPSVLVTSESERTNVLARAAADQVAAEGFISIVPDVLTGSGPEMARAYAAALPAANGITAHLGLDFDSGRAAVGTTKFPLTPAIWPQIVGQLTSIEASPYRAHASRETSPYRARASRLTGNRPTPLQSRPAIMSREHAMHVGQMLMPMSAQQAGGSTAPRTIPGLGEKQTDLPASYYTATATLARSKVKREWVDIPLGDVKLHAWVEYPEGNGKAGVVIVMQHAVGLDDWTRSVADQLALQGFIAVAPDPWSGIGPNGGNRDSFEFDDDAMRAAARITPDETIRRYKAAREWALKLPRANGKTGSIGFCAGGNNSFRFAGEVPDLNAAVVFYGVVPSQDLASKINAPVLGFYGENDARVTSTVQPTIELMKKLGKSYEPHVYPKVTHSFVYFQDLSENRSAVADAWPRAIAFFNRYLK
jgi:carboxymethylenebutenolidase